MMGISDEYQESNGYKHSNTTKEYPDGFRGR